MIKKLRTRFIVVCMTVFSLVALLLIFSINIANYYRTTKGHDETLQRIYEYNSSFEQEEEPPEITDMPWAGGDENEFTLRFFSIRCTEDGEMIIFDATYISSIDEQTAQEYTQTVLNKHKNSGYYKDYRYLVSKSNDDIEIIFLNVADANNYRNILFVTSCVIGIIALLIAFILIVLFSNYAIRPFVKNIEQQKQFITNASHELKTPVTSISTSADILAMDDNNEWIQNIQNQSSRLTRLIGNLVLLSRMDEEHPFEEVEEFSFSEVVWELTEHYESLANAQNKTFTKQIEEDIDFKGDRNSIQQMISILLDNAIRYSDVQGTISLILQKRHGSIVLEIYNTCQSLPDIDLNRLFERFYRPDESRSKYTGGSGIGLSIAQAIVNRHGGKIKVSSTDKHSIAFTVIL